MLGRVTPRPSILVRFLPAEELQGREQVEAAGATAGEPCSLTILQAVPQNISEELRGGTDTLGQVAPWLWVLRYPSLD